MLIKVTVKAFPFPFKCKGADERLNMNYMSSDLYPQSLKESNCAFKETDDINTDAWTDYLYNNHMSV